MNPSPVPSTELPLEIDLAADYYHRYPSEVVTLYARVRVHQPLPGLAIQVRLPHGLFPLDGHALTETPLAVAPLEGDSPQGAQFRAGFDRPLLDEDPTSQTTNFTWERVGPIPAGLQAEFAAQARVRAVDALTYLTIEAVANSAPDWQVSASARLEIRPKSQYLRYLPAVYQNDDLMGRFLMLFESFWSPIDVQIRQMSHYFDPRLTPPAFLPWLASWLDLTLNERWPEDRRRELMFSAVSLYRKRGTRQGLEELLELYTGQRAEISEQFSRDLRLGKDAVLGKGFALGRGNQPNIFTVVVRLPPLSGSPAEVHQAENERRRAIRAIIEAEKPAYAGYKLIMESV